MKKHLIWAALSAVLGASPVLAQTNVNTNSAANSQSNAGSLSLSQGGNVQLNSTVPDTTTARNTIRQRLVTPPSVVAPGLAAAGIETCLGSVSGGVSVMGGGGSFGTSVKDDDCNRRLYARQLWNMGFKQAATNIQCLSPEVQYAMAAAGTPCFTTSPPGEIAGRGIVGPRAYVPSSVAGSQTPATAVVVQQRSEASPAPQATAPAAYANLSESPSSTQESDWLARSSN